MSRIEIKAELAVDDTGAITGLAWPWDLPDRVGDVITKGAFRGVRGPVPMLYKHNPADPVGAWDTITETDRGLEVKGRLLVDDVERAREVRALVKAGAITGLSIGFRVRKAVPRPGRGRTISAAALEEVSLCSVPVHPGARIHTVKSAAAAIALAEAINRAAAALRTR